VHLFVCTSQGLVAASEDLKKAAAEHDNPPPLQPPPLALTGGPKAIKAEPKAITTAESAAKDSKMRAKEKELQDVEKQLEANKMALEAMQGELNSVQSARVDDMKQIIQGAKETGVCMHLRICFLHPTHYSSTLLVKGRAEAQAVELDHLRTRDTTHTNDIRMANIRSGADGAVAQQMAALQFAATLAAATGVPVGKPIGSMMSDLESGMFPTPCHLRISL